MKPTHSRLILVWGFFSFLILGTLPQPAQAQNFSSDARRIAMGGAGDSNNTASRLVEDQRDYRVIPIPIGLIQVLKKREIFDPNDPNYDPARAIEYAADPLHFTLNRDSSGPGNRLVRNLVDAQLSRDLNVYRGFTPASEINAQGLIAPTWGKTFHVAESADTGAYQGFFVGAGPYISLGTKLNIDQSLVDLFSSPTDVYLPDSNFLVNDATRGQAALSITGGYRSRFVPAGFSGGGNEGVYVAADYNYLRGYHYEAADLQTRFDTDSAGLLTLAPTTTPVTVDRTTGKTGNGFAIDLAMAVVKRRWDVSFGVDGIGNRIDWKELSGRRYVLQSLFDGADFITTSVPVSVTEERVTLPVRYAGAGGYQSERWSAATEIGRGLQGFRFNAGGEYLVGPLAFRAGARLSRDLWHPAAGIGLNITRRFGVDVAALETRTNIENDPRTSFAVSLRINRPRP